MVSGTIIPTIARGLSQFAGLRVHPVHSQAPGGGGTGTETEEIKVTHDIFPIGQVYNYLPV